MDGSDDNKIKDRDHENDVLEFKVNLFFPIILIVLSIAGFLLTTYFPPSYNKDKPPPISLERNDQYWGALATAGLSMMGLSNKRK